MTNRNQPSKLGNYLSEWRAKPEPARRRAALFGSIFLTAIIVVVWLVNFRLTGGIQTGPNTIQTAAVATPAPDFFARLALGWENLKSIINHGQRN